MSLKRAGKAVGKAFRPIMGGLATIGMGLALLVQLSGPAEAAQASRVNLSLSDLGQGDNSTAISVPANKSRILKVDVPFADLLVGNPEIADVLPLTDRTVYILGKSLGTTSLAVYDKKKQLLGIVNIDVTYDIDGLKAKLNRLVPGEVIEVHSANAAVVLKGVVSSLSQQDKVLAVAEQYAPGKVTNLMAVADAQQVLLKVKFAEVSRSTFKGISTNTAVSFNGQDSDGSLITGLTSIGAGFLTGTIGFTIGNTLLDLFLDAGEEKGIVKTLAEPNLIALSGDTAEFLAGGEFPVPVAQDSSASGTAITVEFKEFGVRLAFTPTVLDKELINLVVAPEVSSLANSITQISGFNIPSLTTRRARTTVELRAGQSFAIAGLLQSNFKDTVDQVPGLGDVPILGALARSSEFTQEETELVIIITPYLVQPALAGTLAAPTDYFVPPSDFDIFLFGQTEGDKAPGGPATDGRQILSQRGDGGIDGKYGYVIK
ncbi:type II and III secretion system protein family protein [Sneathiella chinensis]|nr:type II and III secretion system protein family protein [Sneathiella chinensis]